MPVSEAMSVALITGITGQDGSYLSDRLVAEGVTVHGMVRPVDDATPPFRASHPEIVLHDVDLADDAGVRDLVRATSPDEIYNLAGISSVALSWEEPVLTGVLSGIAVASLLAAAWQVQEETGRSVRVVQASSAEIFGQPARSPQDEQTLVRPVSPYGAAKAYGHHIAAVYRARGLHVASCIMFNHESPRRPLTFVTRKITHATARLGLGMPGRLTLGNLEARRDWGWAADYVDAMVRAVRHDVADDFVIATGVTHSVAEFVEVAMACVGVSDWRAHVETDEAFLRPIDATELVGDATKARVELGWAATVDFETIVQRMVEHDLQLLREGR